MRDGKSITVPITLEEVARSEREKLSAENTNDKPRWGLGIADITPELREQLKAPEDLHGAVIQRVLPGSPSDDAGLQPGQVILGVNRHETKERIGRAEGPRERAQGTGRSGAHLANGGNTFRVLHSSNGA